MTRLERIDAICLEQQEYPCTHGCCGNDLASALAPLLPLLRAWVDAVAAAEEAARVSDKVSFEANSKAIDAEIELAAALRDSGGGR